MEKYNRIMNKKRMTTGEAIDIVDEMYQDRMKQIEENNTIYTDRLDNIEFTNLEFASVILLREVQRLRRELENSIPKKKIEDKIEDYQERKRYYEDENIKKDNEYFSIIEVLEILQEILED